MNRVNQVYLVNLGSLETEDLQGRWENQGEKDNLGTQAIEASKVILAPQVHLALLVW